MCGMTTFVLLHGIPGAASSWRLVAEHLGIEHTVVAPDLLGFGDRHPGRGSDGLLAPAQADAVITMLRQRELSEVILVGHDFGGPVAAHVVASAPERIAGLALLATNALPDTPIPFPLSTATLPVIGSIAAWALFSRPSLSLMLRQGVATPEVSLDASIYIGDASQHDAIATIFRNSLRRLAELYQPVSDALRSVAVPTIVGWGDHDPFFSVAVGRRTADLIPGARFRVYEGAGHFLPEERPDDIAHDLLELAAATRPA
jgi:pimeloyl-ACP methyl ester carboxylesterase